MTANTWAGPHKTQSSTVCSARLYSVHPYTGLNDRRQYTSTDCRVTCACHAIRFTPSPFARDCLTVSAHTARLSL